MHQDSLTSRGYMNRADGFLFMEQDKNSDPLHFKLSIKSQIKHLHMWYLIF